jgi:CheY-like chemotaxis protein
MRSGNMQKLSAVVVDDDMFIRLHACGILEDVGFDCLDAPTAEAAVAILEETGQSVALLFTDVQMPGSIDGFALARLTAMRWPHVAILVASGQSAPRPGDLPDNACFIGKPFTAEIVRRHLVRVLPEARRPAPLSAWTPESSPSH